MTKKALRPGCQTCLQIQSGLLSSQRSSRALATKRVAVAEKSFVGSGAAAAKELFEVNDLYSANSLAKSNDRAAKALKDLREAEVEEDDEL